MNFKKKISFLLLWSREKLFSSPQNTLLSLFIFSLFFLIFSPLFRWLFVDSVWSGGVEACRVARGACFPFIREKFDSIIFGLYPRHLLWRPTLSMALLLSFLWWSSQPKRWTRRLLWRWIKLILLMGILMKGGVLGLEAVDIEKWGGLPLTLLLSFFGLLFSYPLGIILALGRTGKLPLLRLICLSYIELIRGVPMISLLFMASVMLPLFLPENAPPFPKLLRAQVAIIMFVSAYMAEAIRGGLMAIGRGQEEAADSLGLSYWQKQRKIILPQALKVVIAPMVNISIGMFKDTSLVVVIALSDLLMTTKSALRDPKWLGFFLEAYFFVGLIYFIFCFWMARYSKKLERDFSYGDKV